MTTKTTKKMTTVKTKMASLITALTLASVLSLNSCNFVKKETESVQDMLTENTSNYHSKTAEDSDKQDALIFVKDQSGSIKNGEEENLRLKKYLKKLLYAQFKPKTNLVLMQVDNFSGAPTNQIVIPYEEPKTTGTEDLGDNETLKEFEKQNAEKREMKQMEQSFYKKFFSEPIFKKSSHTCILDLIPQLEKQMLQHKNAHLYFYSDMLEDSDYRIILNDLDTRNTAEIMAEEDLKKLEKKYGKPEGDLSNVKGITIIIPTNTYPDKIDILQFYWQKVFESAGFKGKILWERLPQ